MRLFPRSAPAISGTVLDITGLRLSLGSLALLVVGMAVALRAASLQALPFSLAEAERAFQAQAVAEGAIPPGWPGDLTATLTALLFRLGMDGEWAARAISAAAGALVVALAYWWARPLGRASAILAALLLALSPLAVGASRAAVPGAMGGAWTLMASGAFLRYGMEGRRVWAVVTGGALGLALASDEVGVMGALALAIFAVADAALVGEEAALRRLGGDRRALVGGVVALATAVALGAVRFGLGPQRLWVPGLRLWGEMLDLWGDHLPRPLFLWALIGYEPLLVVGGVAAVGWLALRWLREGEALGPAQRLVVVWALVAALALALASHRHVGQLLGLLIPLALAGGIGAAQAMAQAPWGALGRTWPLAAVTLALLAGIGIVLGQWARPGGTLGGPKALGLWLAALALVGTITVAWRAWRWRAVPSLAVALGVVWTVTSLHGAFALGFGQGDEFVLGARPTPALTPFLRQLPEGEGPLGLAEDLAWLGWYLRHRPLVVGDPTPAVSVYVGKEEAAPKDFVARGLGMTVAAAPALPPMTLRQGWRWFLLREVEGHSLEVEAQIYTRP